MVLGESSNKTDSSTSRGRLAEEVAQAYLLGKGYRLIACNRRTPVGEMDVVCTSGSLLVIVEVKARASNRFGSPMEAISPVKLRRLRAAANWWSAFEGRRFDRVRFDAVVVSLDQEGLPLALRHYPDLYQDGAV